MLLDLCLVAWGLSSLDHKSMLARDAEATENSCYVLLCGDYPPSVKGYYHKLMLARTPRLQLLCLAVGSIFPRSKSTITS